MYLRRTKPRTPDTSERLTEVRDVFLFSCYTGFAYQDVYNLTPDNIVTGIDGEKWIATDRRKTGMPERVPLLPIALEIVDKYRNHLWCSSKNRLLPLTPTSVIMAT
jgi:hypothetical protein